LEGDLSQTRESAFLAGGGAMGALMRSRDWTVTPLGSLESWSQSLRAAVSIMLNSRYPIALYWGPGLALLYNDAWSPIPGGKHPWALGRPGREVWPEIWDTIGPLYSRVLSTGEGVWQEDELLAMFRHGYVEECYFNFTFSPVRGEDGQIDGIFNAVLETTDRVLSERRLRTLSRMGERADSMLSVEAACGWAAGILVENAADAPFALVYVRHGDEARLAAAKCVEAGSVAAPLVIPLDDREPSVWPLGYVDRSGEAMAAPMPAGFDLCGPVWPEPIRQVGITPIKGAGEARPTAFLVVGVSPRLALDTNYRSFLEVAAGHVGNVIAAARAYEEERRRAEALAEIDRAKTAFFSNVSHEFRTPLTLMLGPLEDVLAHKDGLSNEQHNRLDMAHRNALRLLRLVNALLDFSRIEEGRIQASFRPTELATLTAELVSSFQSATDKAGLRLIVDAPPLPQLAYVDRDMWEKIVLNLLSNAFKFTFEGEIAVTLRQEDGNARLTVRDTGTGIPESELPRLFDRFHRIEGAKGRSFEGSGIGLALVQELIKQHGGEITVSSEMGRGTLFTVSLPLGNTHLPADRVEATADVVPTAVRAQAFLEEALHWLPADELLDAGSTPNMPIVSGPPGDNVKRQRVLIADDNADLRGYIARLLIDRGYEVQAVADGEAALTAIRAARPDLLVTDVMMPRLGGFELLRAVREDAELRHLPIIMLSARAGEEAKVEGFDAGVDDYLVKPFSSRELLARVAANIAMARVRREANETVAATEARAARVLAGMTEGYMLLDRDFRVVEINEEGLRLAGRPREAILGRSYWENWPGTEMKAQGLLFKRVMAERKPGSVEICVERADGRGAWFEIDAYPVPDGVAIFYRDVSDRKRAEDALRELNATLDRRVKERTRELMSAEEALRQAQKMEAMGQLTGGVAHDFNNLLTPIVGALDMLRRKGLGGNREQRLIDGAAQSAERAKTLVQRLLAFARRQPLQPVAVDMAKLVTGMADLIRSTSGPQIRVVVEVQDNLAPAKADPNQLEMALLNLSVNARDAMPDGGTLRISAGEERVSFGHTSKLEPGRYIRLSVADTGLGMDKTTLARAVEPFFSTKGVGKGTGLGLSMVHGLVSQLGGALTIQSRQGIGTNVELWLPISQVIPEMAAEQAAAVVAPAAGTALLVDDEELVRMTTAEMLSDFGFAVAEAGSAAEALRLIRDGLRPDLLITDHLMPGMNGTELARIIRSEQPGVQILIVSGYAESEGVAPDLPRLTKPFRSDELAASVASLQFQIGYIVEPEADGYT
jgi:PAS domain S-box-containing protein